MASGSWLLTTSGAWNNNANWSAAFPNATTDTATFATDITGTTTVTMGQAISVGSMTFSDNGASGSEWLISPGGANTLTLGASTITTTTDATISAVIAAGTNALTKAGAATLTLSGGGTGTGAWTVNAGTLAITTSAITSTLGAIIVASGATLTSSVAISKPITANLGSTVTLSGATTGTLTVASRNFTLTGAATSSMSVTLNNTGAMTIGPSRTLSITGASSDFLVGDTSGTSGAIYQTGAGSSIAVGTKRIYLSSSSPGYGYYLGTAGSVNSALGFMAGAGILEVNGVSFTNAAAIQLGQNIAAFNGYSAQAIFRQGTHSLGSLSLGNSSSSVSPAQFHAIITGSADVTFSSIASTGGSTAQGSLVVTSGASLTTVNGSVGSQPTAIHLIGGAKYTQTGATTAAQNIRLYGNGNKLGSGSGSSGVITANIVNSSGSGIATITGGTGGVGYIGPPTVSVIDSGGGSGAVVTANWNAGTGQIDGYTIHSPGISYNLATTSITLQGGGATSAVTAPTVTALTPNSTDGTITKEDSGTVALIGNNTNTGAYTVSAGTLRIGNAGAAGTLGNNNTSNASVAFGAVLAFNRNDAPPTLLTYTGVISGAGNITKTTSGGTAVLDADNTFTGSVTATTGALRAVRVQSFGLGNKTLSTGSGGALELANNITLPLAQAVTLLGTGVSSTGALRNISGNNTIQGPLSISGAFSIGSDAGTLTLSNPGAVALTSANTATFVGNGDIDLSPTFTGTNGTVTKASGTGCAILRGTNTYTGATTITAGLLGYVGSISGANGSFGSSTSILIAAGAGVRYYGAGGTWAARSYTFQGGAGTTNRLEADASATGAINHQLAPTFGITNVTKTIQLGGTSTQSNKISFAVINNGTGAVSVTKADAGKWELSANNTATGAYAVNGGTLVLSGTNTPASVAVSNSGSTLVFSVATWSGFSTRTGTATVTVNANAKIQTLTGSGASAQNGRHGYNNLTFAANARIRIGG